jgi:hypothetical protein
MSIRGFESFLLLAVASLSLDRMATAEGRDGD